MCHIMFDMIQFWFLFSPPKREYSALTAQRISRPWLTLARDLARLKIYRSVDVRNIEQRKVKNGKKILFSWLNGVLGYAITPAAL